MDTNLPEQNTPPEITPNGSRPKSTLFFSITGIVILCIGIGIGYTLASHNSSRVANKAITNLPVASPTSQTVPSSTITPTSVISSSSAEPKTYRSATYSISFQYPGDGVVDTNPVNGEYVISVNTKGLSPLTQVEIQNSRDALIKGNNYNSLNNWYDLKFHVYNNLQNIPLDAMATYVNAYGAKNKFTKTETVAIDGISGIMGIWESGDVGRAKIAIFNRAGKTYLFEMWGDNGEYSPAGEKVLTSILNSAHFTK